MTTVNVQFADSTQKIIVSYFFAPPDPGLYTNTGTVDSSDERWKAFFDAQDALTQMMLPSPTT